MASESRYFAGEKIGRQPVPERRRTGAGSLFILPIKSIDCCNISQEFGKSRRMDLANMWEMGEKVQYLDGICAKKLNFFQKNIRNTSGEERGFLKLTLDFFAWKAHNSSISLHREFQPDTAGPPAGGWNPLNRRGKGHSAPMRRLNPSRGKLCGPLRPYAFNKAFQIRFRCISGYTL